MKKAAPPSDPRLHTLLRNGLAVPLLPVFAPLLKTLESGLHDWLAKNAGARASEPHVYLVDYLNHAVRQIHEVIIDLHRLQSDFSARYTRAVLPVEQQRLVLEFARQLGANRRQLRGDRQAFARWFGYDAVHDRYLRRVAEQERQLAFILERLGEVSRLMLLETAAQHRLAWRRLGLEEILRPLLAYGGDSRVREAAFRCLASGLRGLSGTLLENAVAETTVLYIFRAAMDHRQPVWIQCEALSLLDAMGAHEVLSRVLQTRLSTPDSNPDDIFVRQRAAQLFGRHLPRDPAQMRPLLETVLADPGPYVRQALAKALVAHLENPQLPEARRGFYRLLRKDDAPQVRAAALLELLGVLPRMLAQISIWMADILEQEPDGFVLRVALREIPRHYQKLCSSKRSPSLGLESAAEVSQRARQADAPEIHPDTSNPRIGLLSSEALSYLSRLQAPLATLHVKAENLAVRRWAAQTREQLWCLCTPAAAGLYAQLAPVLRAVPPGQWRKIPVAATGVPKFTLATARGFSRRPEAQRHSEAPQTDAALAKVNFGTPLEAKVNFGTPIAFDEDTLGRVLALLAVNDHGFDVELTRRALYITRGHVFGVRLWRLWHELRTPSTDKRQGFTHLIGRHFQGTLRAPASQLAEVVQTVVPGEPLHIPEEGDWRPHLPLPDELLDALAHGQTVCSYAGEGVTEIQPPAALWRRIYARSRLTLDFVRYAELRNWREHSAFPPDSYLRELSRLGFQFRFRAHAYDAPLPDPPPPRGEGDIWQANPAVTRFFPALTPWGFVEDYWLRLYDYFFSVYENTLAQLGLFLGVSSVFFFGRHIYLNQRIRGHRAQIPLSIGGWGTRGKSGTERIKAALFNALGHTVVSKTTGCEAMFLYSRPFGPLREMFLFRPYDKATIWEQANVLSLAAKLDADVFLWECMALTPEYVRILAQHWVCDDLATLTNAYPDHEDLQGPAGVNIPQVMLNFIPPRATVISSEENMQPILRSGAEAVGSTFKSVGWLEAGLLTPDVLARFPYDEHPYNIALVLAMGKELGISEPFALKEMADRVVLDLGVLKTYPTAHVEGRRLQFINGMSANERYGCLGNWQRMGFDRQDPYDEPGVWITTVVNNRADRIPRSRVFASILVDDVSADCHFLIGTNLDGLRAYIREAWDEYIHSVSLWPEDNADGVETLTKLWRRLRLPYQAAHVQQGLAALLAGLGYEESEELSRLWNEPAQLRKTLSPPLEKGGQGGFSKNRGSVENPPQPPFSKGGSAENPPSPFSKEGSMVALDQLLAHLETQTQAWQDYETLAEQCRQTQSAAQREALNQTVRERLWHWFQHKLVIIEDPYASGEQVLKTVWETTPPGMFNRCMGVQNIKGTGLDFVYRWQAWDTCYQACAQLAASEPHIAQQGLQALAAFQEYGQLSARKVQETLAQVKSRPHAQSEQFQAQLNIITSCLTLALEALAKQLQSSSGGGRQSRWLSIISGIEAFLDAGDAVKRRRRADLIYRELTAERISHERAALELKALNKRQKGGWLVKRVSDWLGGWRKKSNG